MSPLMLDKKDEVKWQNPDDLAAELKAYEAAEAKALGLEDQPADWTDEATNPEFYADTRDTTTVLVSGLTWAHDIFVQAAMTGMGMRVQTMDPPDNDALQAGKEFGNRGQCNPTYFTVGNLVKYLIMLRDKKGMAAQDIIDKYVFMTAGACGPCRFGMYVTEYRKALRDAGFEGFRVKLFEFQGGVKQASGKEEGIKMGATFFKGLSKAIFAGDVMNLMGYRMRPYEVIPNSTNQALDVARAFVVEALKNNHSVLRALWKARKVLQKVELNRTIAKPKVSIIGEFWAMTTEGDGNYHLQKFLEKEGAEVDIQTVSAWILYNLWTARADTRERAVLKKNDSQTKSGLKNDKVSKKLAILWGCEFILRGVFQTFAKVLGVSNYHLPDMEENGKVAKEFYDTKLRGGEGHMEVGKLIQTVTHKKAHMVISVKPFGCMPSSGVSDGVQSLITEKYPDALFLPIETTGDGAVNVYSRIQMMLFKARLKAQAELENLLKEKKLDVETVKKKAGKKKLAVSSYYSKHKVAGTAANLVYDVA